jgi:hypothetical protein
MASLAEIRARIAAEQESRNKVSTPQSYDNVIYAHWNIPENTTATIRFLPDKNSLNEYFWVERQMMKFPFNGVIGRPDIKHVEVQVPCVEMWGDKCPVHEELRAWYRDESLKDLASKYWKKRNYFFQGLVRTNPYAEDKAPENPIRRFNISPQIFTIIKASLMDPEITELPTDYLRGLDFNIKKTMKANYADYSTSNWARRESTLTEAELEAVEKYGLFDLAEFLPKRPGEAELRIIVEMFNASTDNQPYDPSRWGSYYKPWNLELSGDNNISSRPENSSPRVSVPVSKPIVEVAETKPQVDQLDEPMDVAEVSIPAKPAVSSDKAQDILAIIRARQQAKA